MNKNLEFILVVIFIITYVLAHIPLVPMQFIYRRLYLLFIWVFNANKVAHIKSSMDNIRCNLKRMKTEESSKDFYEYRITHAINRFHNILSGKQCFLQLYNMVDRILEYRLLRRNNNECKIEIKALRNTVTIYIVTKITPVNYICSSNPFSSYDSPLGKYWIPMYVDTIYS